MKDRKAKSKARRRAAKDARRGGAAVNPDFPEPSSPGLWVNAERCICGATYKAFRGAVSFAEAVNMIRTKAKAEGDDGGGYRSAGPVLWVMRTTKLSAWFLEHAFCGQALEESVCEWCKPSAIPCRFCLSECDRAFVDSMDSST